MIDALPLTVTPPFERTEQPVAAIVAVPEAETAAAVVPSARMQGWAEALGIASEIEPAPRLYEFAVTKSFANTSVTGCRTMTWKAASVATLTPETCCTTSRPSVSVFVPALHRRVPAARPLSSARSAAAPAATYALDPV